MIKYKEILLSAVLLSLISGCSFKSDIPREETASFKLESLKIIDKKMFVKSEDAGFFKEKSLPAYFGPSALITKEDYLLKKYAEEPLLASNFGVNNYLYLILNNPSESSEETARSLGFKNIEGLYSFIYKSFHNKPLSDFDYFIKYLEKNNLVSSDKIYNESNLNQETKHIIKTMYYPYFSFDDTSTLNSSWFLESNNLKIYFTEEDFKPYAFVILIVEEILSSKNPNKVIINGI